MGNGKGGSLQFPIMCVGEGGVIIIINCYWGENFEKVQFDHSLQLDTEEYFM